MKTPTKRATRRLAASLAIATAFAATGAWAATTTYYQAKNWEGPAELSHGQDGTDIGYTPQLAFPGITLDDIPVGATFYTTIYGDSISAEYTISVGMHETRCDINGDGRADKMALQFAIYDGANNAKYTKCVILVFTNVEGEGVHVQKYCQFYRNVKNNWSPNTKYFAMDSSGNITMQNSPSSWNESATSYCASGLWTHGMSLANMSAGNAEAKLVFPGTTLKQLNGSSFMSGYRFGKNLENLAEADDEATFVTNWPSDDDIEKIVMQFRARGTNNRTAIIELAEANGNVYAKHVLSCYNGAANTKYFNIDDNGTVSLASGTCTDTGYNDAYPVHDFYVQHHPRVPKTPNKIKVFSDPSKTLTLDDIQYGDFTARMCGWIGASFRETHNTGYNKKVYNDETSGSVTNIVVEFQVRDGNYTKCLVVSFTNGEGGIYAEAINARYSDTLSLGSQFRDYNGTLHGNPNDKSGEIVAETLTADGYGAFDLRVSVPETTVWVLDQTKTWSELRNGAEIGSDSAVCIKVIDANATLTINENVNVSKIEFVNGNGATLQINSGKTLTADSITGIGDVINNGTLVKTGAGVTTLPFNTDSTGKTVVDDGTLKVASKSGGSGTDYTVRVKGGATFDANGVGDVTVNVILEEGAKFANSGADITDLTKQTVKVTLEGNATATFAGDFGILGPNHGATRLELGENTLTLDGSNKNFWLCNTTITGTGKIQVDHGYLTCCRSDSTGTECTIVINQGGALKLDKNLTVANFENNSNYDVSGTSTLTVTGTLTPGPKKIPRLTLADGATVKATGTAQVVSTKFSATGAYTIDASAITKAQLDDAEKQRIAVLTVPTSQKGGTWTVANPPVDGCRAKWVDNDDGTSTLYLCKSPGTIFIIR